MKSYESTLAFFSGRRVCRPSGSILPPTIDLKRISIILSFVSIFSLFSSVAAVQDHLVNQPHISSPIILTNGTTTFNSSRQRLQSTIPFFSSITTTAHDGTNNRTKLPTTRSPAHLIITIMICPLMCILTIVGNLVVILTVCLVRKLQTASNILIVSLAVSDIFVGLIIMPLAMVPEIANRWILGSIMCDIWTSTDVLLCTSSILNFLVISIDRYFIINHPFKYAPMRKAKLLLLMIAGVWILSALVSLPPVLGWGRRKDDPDVCVVNPTLEYQIFATSLSFYIPLIVVLIIYANIYRTAQSAMDTRSSVQMSQYVTPYNSSPNFKSVSKAVSQPQSNGNSCSTPQIYRSVSNSNNPDENNSISTAKHSNNKRSKAHLHVSKSHSLFSPARCLGRRLSTPFNGRISIFVTRRHTFFRHVHLPNQKAIRTLGVILGTFIVCWLPFMLFAIIKPLHLYITGLTGAPRIINAPAWLDSVLLWFGYTSSMLNPIIYSKFNREFRTPFREIMCCRCKGLNEKIRRQEYLDNLYGENHLQPPPPAAPPLLTTSARNTEAAV